MLLLSLACVGGLPDSGPVPRPGFPVPSLCTDPGSAPSWTDQAEDWGLVDTRDGLEERDAGGSAGLADLDGDGDLDLLTSHRSRGVLVQENLGERFAEAQIVTALPSAVFGLVDLDGDRLLDLAVQGPGEPELWLNRGGLRFERWDTPLPSGHAHGRGIQAGDLEGDGDLDLYWHSGFEDWLLVREGDGFEDASERIELDEGWPWKSWGAAWTDLDRDGDVDLYVSNDLQAEHGPSRLYWNEGGELVRDDGGCACEHTVGSMGMSVGDVDGNGQLDLLISSTESLGLYANQGDGSFIDVSAVWRLRAIYDWNQMSLGTLLEDLDLDGDLDLFLAGGRFGEGPVLDNQELDQPDLLLWNEGERFEADTQLTDPADARGVASGDLNGDGWPDLFVANVDAPSRLWMSACSAERVSLSVELDMPGNRYGIGGLVELETEEGLQLREIRSERGLFGSVQPRALFGLGAEEEVQALRVHWPGEPQPVEVELEELGPLVVIER